MKILHINAVCGVTGTGRIVTDLCREAQKRGHECVAAYGEHHYKNSSEGVSTFPIGTVWDCRIHGLLTRVFDMQGFGSVHATKEFLKKVDQFRPDIIHLHNLHGYYINIKLLFDYIRQNNVRTVWTLHDCWALTGHCVYFQNIGCGKWKTQCYDCPLKKEYPSSFMLDNSRRNYTEKRAAFAGIEQMTILVPSRWLADRVKQSFLKEYEVKVIYNGIDLNKYKPLENDFKKRHGIEDKCMVLGVANIWTERKGLDIFLELANRLDDEYVIILVGLNTEQMRNLPENVIGFKRTDTVEELVRIYTAADIFVNPSTEETFGLTVAEAMACGTYSIVYESTACAEVVRKGTGRIVPEGIDEIEKAVMSCWKNKSGENIEKYARFFSSERFAEEVLAVYEEERH